ncbi:hypothetical protein GL2_30090 [Microbulbifer sp. GL-2]|nr:hypothetical protein GL2_30090 [Microbulbifer sp. GL-2]
MLLIGISYSHYVYLQNDWQALNLPNHAEGHLTGYQTGNYELGNSRTQFHLLKATPQDWL